MRWYVYELCDPRTERPFYIGKGCGRRMYSHLKKSAAQHVKVVVDAIRARGDEPVVREVAYFWEEQDALNFETRRIAENKNLANRAKNKARPISFGLYETLRGALLGTLPAEVIVRRLGIIESGLHQIKNPEHVELYKQLICIGRGAAARM